MQRKKNTKLVINTAEAKCRPLCAEIEAYAPHPPAMLLPESTIPTPRYATGYSATHFQAWTAHKSTKSTHSGDTRGSLVYTLRRHPLVLHTLRYNDTISQLRQMLRAG